MDELDTNMTAFQTLHLRGKRFDSDPGMPVETLGELVAYRDLVVEVAKHLFHLNNPERQRVPKGFTDSFQLRVRKVDEGSALAVLERPTARSLTLFDDEFEIARDLIVQAVRASEAGESIPEDFPKEVLVYFNRFGQGLREDESIELKSKSGGSGPNYTRDVRKRLVLASQARYQEETELLGRVTEIDADRMRFHLKLEDGRVVPAPIDTVMFVDVKQALAPMAGGAPVKVSGIGVFDREDVLLSLDSVHDLAIFEEDGYEMVITSLEEISELTDGWLDGAGSAPDSRVMERTRLILTDLRIQDVPAPHVYPVPDGGIQAEWTIGQREVSVTFEPDGTIYFHSLDLSSGDISDETLDAGSSDAVARLVMSNPA